MTKDISLPATQIDLQILTADIPEDRRTQMIKRVAEMEMRETEYLVYRFLKAHPELSIDEIELVREERDLQTVIFPRKRVPAKAF